MPSAVARAQLFTMSRGFLLLVVAVGRSARHLPPSLERASELSSSLSFCILFFENSRGSRRKTMARCEADTGGTRCAEYTKDEENCRGCQL